VPIGVKIFGPLITAPWQRGSGRCVDEPKIRKYFHHLEIELST
jgi:hypothetical protein